MVQHFMTGGARKMTRKKSCPICETLRLLNGKWDLMVIRYLVEGPKRFAELKASIPDLSSKSLSATLKQLNAKGMIVRDVNSSYPISVVYSLTAKGDDMKDIVEALRQWGKKWLPA
jgi:DNA-binding HxlR family transcriptional regulator